MLEKLLTGPKTYYLWLLFLLAVIAGCGLVYLQQLQEGLSITGMSRDVSWASTSRSSPILWVWPLPPSCWCCPPTSTTTRSSSA